MGEQGHLQFPNYDVGGLVPSLGEIECILEKLAVGMARWEEGGDVFEVEFDDFVHRRCMGLCHLAGAVVCSCLGMPLRSCSVEVCDQIHICTICSHVVCRLRPL